MDISEVLPRIKDVMSRIEPEARIILYGSQARGDAREDSDIDLLILLPDSYEEKEYVRNKLDISGRLFDSRQAGDYEDFVYYDM